MDDEARTASRYRELEIQSFTYLVMRMECILLLYLSRWPFFFISCVLIEKHSFSIPLILCVLKRFLFSFCYIVLK